MNIEECKKIMTLYATKLNIEFTEEQLEKFYQYMNLLLEWNEKINLTAIVEPKEVILKHFIDSLTINKYLKENSTLADVGTGAGFPGIPLAIVLDNAEFVLMDSLNKRINFLNEVTKMCELKNVSAIHARAEELGRDVQYREKFDICVSRAVANMSTLLEYCIPFVKVDGVFVSYKSGDIKEEIVAADNAQKQLFCKNKDVIKFSLPNTDINRSFVIFEKKKELNKKYPRQGGKPKKNPL